MTPLRRRRVAHDRRGAALLAALATIVVLSAVTAIAARGARTTAAVVANARADVIARAMAESGILAAQARIERALAAAGSDSTARQGAFDALVREPSTADGPPVPFVSDTLGDGAFAVALVNVSARFDVNSGDVEGLTRLFATAAPPAEARAAAERVTAAWRRARTERDRTRNAADLARDSVAASLLGRAAMPMTSGAFESLDAVGAVLGADAPWLASVAPLLTVDGDGTIDRRHAPAAVLRAATGALADAPTRLLLVARGWQPGHPLTREIQAVYAVQENELRLVRWREQSR